MVAEVGTLEVEQRDEVTIVRLLGEHDLATAGEIRRMLEDAVAGGCGAVVSLTETKFIDAAVIRVLFVADRMLRAAGQRLVLHVATASVVSRALDLTGASTTLPCSPSLDEALSIAGTGVPEWDTT